MEKKDVVSNAMLYECSYTAAVPEPGWLLNDVLHWVDLPVSVCVILSTNYAAKIHSDSVIHMLPL